MNAPSTILPPAVAAHAERVTALLPGCFGDQLETRARLLLAADTASAALWCDPTEEQAVMYGEIMRLGQLYAFADAIPTETLKALLMAMRRMLQAAAHLGEFAEGMNARG